MENIYKELKASRNLENEYNALHEKCEDIVWSGTGYVIGFFVVYSAVTFILMIAMMIATTTFLHEETQAYINSFEEQRQGIMVIFGSLFASGFVVNLFVYGFLCYVNEKRKEEIMKEIENVIDFYGLPVFKNIYSFFDNFKDFNSSKKESLFNEENSKLLLLNLKNKDSNLKGFEDFIFENTEHLIKENKQEKTILEEIERRMSDSGLNSQSFRIIEE